MLKRFLSVILFGLLVASCSVKQSVDGTTTENRESEVPVASQTQENAVPTANPLAEKMDTHFNVYLYLPTDFRVYKVEYLAKQTQLPLTEIQVLTMGSEVTAVEVMYITKGSKVRLFKESGDSPIAYVNGNGFNPTDDPKATQCFEGAKKLVQSFEDELLVRDLQLLDLLSVDCPELPNDWLIPFKKDDDDDPEDDLRDIPVEEFQI